ncbi:MAG: pilus assembly protein [Acidimicrobiia bacterium]|nr:pilus assembly protein [Acidimicrobiia bacterium]
MIGWFNRRLRKDREDGAALVEFAIVLPFLMLLLMGMIEFGWAFGNNLDVRHGAREAARLAAVNFGSVAAMGASTCDSMDFSDGQVITFSLLGTAEVGQLARVSVVLSPYTSLSGFLDWAMPAALSTTVEIRLEQKATWASGGTYTCTP